MDIFFAQVSTFFSDLIKGPPLEELEEPEKKVAGPRDSRKRNSLAFNIANFVIYEEDAFAPLVEEVRKELAKVKKPAARAVDESMYVLFILIVKLISFVNPRLDKDY